MNKKAKRHTKIDAPKRKRLKQPSTKGEVLLFACAMLITFSFYGATSYCYSMRIHRRVSGKVIDINSSDNVLTLLYNRQREPLLISFDRTLIDANGEHLPSVNDLVHVVYRANLINGNELLTITDVEKTEKISVPKQCGIPKDESENSDNSYQCSTNPNNSETRGENV